MRSIETPVIRKGDKHQSAEKRGTMVIETFLAKKEFKTQYFFLFDDFLLQVVKKSKACVLPPCTWARASST